jgi:Fibrobacter succinogenes major domain (Fib_succ_major)
MFFLNLLFIALLFLAMTSFAQTAGANSDRKYKTINIDNQAWMAENLNADYFRNGEKIPNAQSAEEWIKAGKEGKPAWCYYENKIDSGLKYGKLYNWFAISDPRGLAPTGWHIPTDTEWTHGGNGTNESGFFGLPAGSRNRFGKFDYIGHVTYWWCSTAYDNEFAWYRVIDESPYYVYRTNFYKQNGYSVRCIKDQNP